ncbi:hypothetical protein VTI28DRAFT_2407 [Corynascus sepedonium]
MGFRLLYGAALLGASAQAFAFLPQPTDPFQALPLEDGWAPRPTPPPDAHLVRRQISLPSSYLIAPDNTCGFIDGNSKSAYACFNEDMRCAFIPTSGKVPGAAGCCKGKECSFRLSCIERSDRDDCDEDCEADDLTLKCTGLVNKHCNTVVFPGGVTDYYCGMRSGSVIRAQTAAKGDKSRSMTEVKPTSTSTKKKTSSRTTKKTSSSSSTSRRSSSTSSSTSKSSTRSTSKSSSVITTSSTVPPVTSSTTDASRAGAATSSSPPEATTAPSTPVGAIVGGVLGGIALIALVIFGAIFLRQHKKKTMAMAEMPPAQPLMGEPTLPNTGPPPAPYPKDVAYSHSHMSGYPPSSTTGAPAQMYAAPMAAAAGMGAGAAAGAGAGAKPSYHSHHPSIRSTATNNNTYFDPSPLTTPGGSPQMQYAHQMHTPPPLPIPPYYNNSSRQAEDAYNSVDGAWPGGSTAGNKTMEPPDRHSTSTPVSTYNGVTPVTPASALGPMPGETQHGRAGSGAAGSSSGGTGGNGGSGVPLILQPGMGYRPYRPPGAGGSAGSARSGSPPSGSGNGNDGVTVNTAKVAMVVPRKAVPTSISSPTARSQGQGQNQAQGTATPKSQQTAAVELP